MRNPITVIRERRHESQLAQPQVKLENEYEIMFFLGDVPVSMFGPLKIDRCYAPEPRLFGGFLSSCEYRPQYFERMGASFGAFEEGKGRKIWPNRNLRDLHAEFHGNIGYFCTLAKPIVRVWEPYAITNKTNLPKGPIRVTSVTMLKDGRPLWKYDFIQKRLYSIGN